VQKATERPEPEGFIRKIRFPHYRNMEPDTELVFSFPVSVFTGANGCGKSSVLQALYGAPEGQSVGRYWFSTDVDPIADATEGKRPSFVYEYMAEDGTILQPVKVRIRKKFSTGLLRTLGRETATAEDKTHDPNYWEPSRPLAWAGLQPRLDGSRDPAVVRDVVYLHFRTQLSAFESAFYGNGPPTTELREHLRIKSRQLLRALEGQPVHRPRGKHQTKKRESISGELIHEVNEIVGKNYTEAHVVEHKLFGDNWAESVRFTLSDATYSDAFAGSGEGAVFRLVRALQAASSGSLVILDEPEISLHPEAQTRLQRLLLAYCLHKNLQVFIATHSSHFVDGLPENAVFLFQRGSTGKFFARNVPHELAMVSIGHQLSKRTIVVEDQTAKRMVERTLGTIDGAQALFNVAVAPGGVGAVFAALVNDASGNLLALLDGDQRPTEDICLAAKGLLNQINVTRQQWDEAISKLTNKNVPTFHQSGDGDSGHAQKKAAEDVRRRFVQAFIDRVHYLPGSGSPEDLLVSTDAINACFSGMGLKDATSLVTSSRDCKNTIKKTSETIGMTYESTCDALLARWANLKGTGFENLKELLQTLIPRQGGK
jgi:predicted ATPase